MEQFQVALVKEKPKTVIQLQDVQAETELKALFEAERLLRDQQGYQIVDSGMLVTGKQLIRDLVVQTEAGEEELYYLCVLKSDGNH